MGLLLAALVAGVAVGIVAADSRIPHLRVVPFVSALIIACLFAVIAFIATRDDPVLPIGLSFAGGMIVSSIAYAIFRWKRLLGSENVSWVECVSGFSGYTELRRRLEAMRSEQAES